MGYYFKFFIFFHIAKSFYFLLRIRYRSSHVDDGFDSNYMVGTLLGHASL